MSRFVSATVITITITSKITTGIQGTIIITGVIGIIMEMGSITITEDIRITTTTRIKDTKEYAKSRSWRAKTPSRSDTFSALARLWRSAMSASVAFVSNYSFRQPINTDISRKMPKNQPIVKIIPSMRKNAADFFRNPGLFSEARSKQAPVSRNVIAITNAIGSLLSSAKSNGSSRID